MRELEEAKTTLENEYNKYRNKDPKPVELDISTPEAIREMMDKFFMKMELCHVRDLDANIYNGVRKALADYALLLDGFDFNEINKKAKASSNSNTNPPL